MYSIQAAHLTLTDPDAKIELAMIKCLSGDSAITKFMHIVASKFPDDVHDATPSTVLVRLDQLKASPQHKLAPRTCQGLLRHVCSMLSDLVEERAPNIGHAEKHAQLQPVIQRFQYFVRHTMHKKPLFGKDAMAEMCKVVLQKHKNKKLMEEDVKQVCMYPWLRPEENRAEVDKAIDAVRHHDSGGSIAAALKAKKEKKSTAGSKSSQGGKSSSDYAVQAALKMFEV